MPKIKNVSGEARHLPWLGGRLVQKGQEIDVPAEHVTAYTQQGELWKPADAEAQQLHDEMLEAIAYLEAVANPPVEPTEADVRAAVATVLASAGADAIIAQMKDADAEIAAVIVEVESVAARPRKTIIAAAEKRLAELAPPPPPDDPPSGDQAAGTTEKIEES